MEDTQAPPIGTKGTVIGIDAGSCSYGMSADSGVLRLTLRAEDQEEYEELVEKIRERAEQQAKEQGMTCTIVGITYHNSEGTLSVVRGFWILLAKG